MTGFRTYLLDQNGDGLFDDIDVRFHVDPETDPGTDFWSRLIDLGAMIGLESQALPLPLFVASDSIDAERFVRIRHQSDIDDLIDDEDRATDAEAPVSNTGARSSDLLDLFTIDGLLADWDEDQLPDATNFMLQIPDAVPTDLGVAICNFAVRVGLESGGVTLPFVSDTGPLLAIQISDAEAEFRAFEGGWLAEGTSDGLATLIEEISRTWPMFGLPDTPGVRSGVEQLAGTIGRSDQDNGDSRNVRWELQWAAQPEVQRLVDAIEQRLIPRLDAESTLKLVVFVCESLPVRRRLEEALRSRIAARGVSRSNVRVLSAFKAGLSWLTEVVLADLEPGSVAKLDVWYRRFEDESGRGHLDLPIRWLQELFPGDEISARQLGLSLDDIAIREMEPSSPLTYRAEAYDEAGKSIGSWECELISYEMPFMLQVSDSGYATVTTGGFIATIGEERVVVPVDTDLDRFWQFWQREVLRDVVAGINQDGGFLVENQPFFGELDVEVWLSAPNSRLGIREENDSAAEALQEDIYFNTLDTIETIGVNSSGQHTSAPGAVAPVIHVVDGITPHAVVRLWEAPTPKLPISICVDRLWLEDGELVAGLLVDSASRPVDTSKLAGIHFEDMQSDQATVRAELEVDGRKVRLHLPLPETLAHDDVFSPPPMNQNIHGSSVEQWAGRASRSNEISAWIEGRSYQGRPIPALALHTSSRGRVWAATKLAILKPTALIVARHHANEISSTNAALMLAHLVAEDDEWSNLIRRLNIVMIPYENPDGAALHARLASQADARTWKHHPARYNALGHEFSENFFSPDSYVGEARVRPGIWKRWLPDAIVDNHGVPSHEWVQPFGGFGSPPRFHVSYWIPQALIYGIIRHVEDPEFPEHRKLAYLLRDRVSEAFHGTDIGKMNAEIGGSYQRWGQFREPDRFPGHFHHGMLWHFGETPVDSHGRGFNVRFPRTTALSWVTEVNDETAIGNHLEMVAHAHLIANRVMLNLMLEVDAPVRRSISRLPDGRVVHQFKRDRPLRAPDFA